jgi:hypothetical protein
VLLIHAEGIVHRDIKPDNILLRARDPLQVALADFGISSVSDPGAAARETRTAATPLYSPPESFPGYSGPAGDWWSVAVVLLECLGGGHPLAGLPLNMVMREISSRGLKVPGGLPPGAGPLLKGLLTRDDRRRWGEEQITAWLSGRRHIPVYYEGDSALNSAGEGQGGFSRPFEFLGNAYRSPKELAGAFAANPASWARAVAVLSRGMVRDWLEENRAYDDAVSIDDTEAETADLKLSSFILHFRGDLGLVYRGERITLKLLTDVLSGALSGPNYQAIADDLTAGRLAGLPKMALRSGVPVPEILRVLLETRVRPEARPLGASTGQPGAAGLAPAPAGAGAGVPGSLAQVLETPAGSEPARLTPRELYIAAVACAGDREAYVWGLGERPPSDRECVERVLSSGEAPVSWKWYEANIPQGVPVPEEVFRGLSGGPPGYSAAARALVRIAALCVESGDSVRRFFYRMRKAKAMGREVDVSPLSIEDYLRYFQFRTVMLREGRRSVPGFHMERVIREREEDAAFRTIRPFSGRGVGLALAGNWIPLLLALLALVWLIATDPFSRPWINVPNPNTSSIPGMRLSAMSSHRSATGAFIAGYLGFSGFAAAFWALAAWMAEGAFTRIRPYINAGAAVNFIALYLGLTAHYAKGPVFCCFLGTLLAYRYLLGILVRRRILRDEADRGWA